MELVLPTATHQDSFIAALKEYQAEELSDRYNLDITSLEEDFPAYVASIISQSLGKNLPEGYVPQTTYWLVDEGEFIGRVSIRHELTEHLRNEGGHIGYDIRPTKRKMGYGTKILELALPKAREIGITKALITCDETNMGSKKIIEANGGVLGNKLQLDPHKPAKLRYWIVT